MRQTKNSIEEGYKTMHYFLCRLLPCLEGELRRLISWLAEAEGDAGVVDEEPVVGELVEGGETTRPCT